jgi:hypothetical protein
MKVIYETFYDDGEYPDSLDYERQDDTGRACCISVKLNCFTDRELQEREKQIAREAFREGFNKCHRFMISGVDEEEAFEDYKNSKVDNV